MKRLDWYFPVRALELEFSVYFKAFISICIYMICVCSLSLKCVCLGVCVCVWGQMHTKAPTCNCMNE